MFCPKCGTKNVDEARFCVACGNPFPTASVTLSGETGNPAVASSEAPGVAPAPRAVNAQPANKAGSQKKLPLIIGGAVAGVIALVLIAVFVVVPAFNKNPFKGCQVGDVVEFGSYEQDGDTSNGKEPIEWRVLAVEGNRAYVVSQKALDAHAFNADEDDGNNWKSSDLKKWLENDFASQAFTGDELEEISGVPTLLSFDEANKYFMSDNDRICMPTQQAVNNGVNKNEGNSACLWWLRSPGDGSDYAGHVDEDGIVLADKNLADSLDGFVPYGGYLVDCPDGAVRPALWVNL